MENEVKEESQTETVNNPEAVLAELRRAQADLKELRAEKKRLESELANKVDESEWKDRALKAETKLALQDAGFKDADRLLKYVGTEGLDFDEDGAVTGLNERLTQLKTDLPELFDPKRRVGGKGDIFANDSVPQKKTSTELQVERIFNRGAIT